MSAGPKKAGGKLGLGVKKLGEKVDDSLFEQAPAPEAPPPVSDPLVTSGTAATSAAAANMRSPVEAAKPAGSRFAYDTLTQVPVRTECMCLTCRLPQLGVCTSLFVLTPVSKVTCLVVLCRSLKCSEARMGT